MTRLSLQAARDLQPGRILRDHVIPGLMLRARGTPDAPGVKSWHYWYVFEGRERRPKIGEFPTVGIEDAREAAKALARDIAKGIDPSAERQARREAPTVADLVELYERVIFPDLSARTREEYARNLRLHVLPRLGRERVAEVTTEQINALLDAVPGATARNRVWANLSGMFRLALHSDYRWRTDRNPATDARKTREAKRKRKVEPSEFMAVARALDTLQGAYPRQVAAIRVMLLAGTRVTELVTATWEHLRDGKITLGVHKTMSTGEDREIYLPAQAREVIDSLPAAPGCPYIFGPGVPRVKGRKTSGAPHLTRYNIRDVWERATVIAGTDGLRVQDLRRTFASVAGTVGVGLDAVGQLFGHSDPKTTRRYQWQYDGAARANAQATADRISDLMGPGAREPS